MKSNLATLLVIFGLGGVAIWLLMRRQTTTFQQIDAPVKNPSTITQFRTAGAGIAGAIGMKVGQAAGLGPASGGLGVASSNLFLRETEAYGQAAQGAKEIVKGNVVSGTKNLIVGGAKTAVAPFTSTYDTIKGLF